MTIPQTLCPTCETQFPPEITGGLCPACLLGEAIELRRSASADIATIHRQPEHSPDPGSFVGDVFGDYELLDEIARGGMGVVYKSRHRRLNRIVALKMILAGQLASDQDIQRFQREAEAAANLDHPGIVPIYEIGEHQNLHFFSMKLVQGGSLADHMAAIRQDQRAIVKLIETVARAVHYAHQRGILHRDLKPANILIDESGEPLITDLGLARRIESKSDITRSGAVVGTPAYMPPEQASASKEITTAVDIYSIGAILYEALTGRPPHVGNSPVETLMQVLRADIAPPREINRKADRLLERICMKCLAKDPNDRYTSAAALADDLDNWLNGRALSVRRPSLTATVAEVLQTNMRSAAGASVIGILAGVLLAFCISKCNTSAAIRNNPPEAVYAAFHRTVPAGRSMMFLSQTEFDTRTLLIAGFSWLGTMACVGAVVAVVVRPRPGTEAVAMGTVAGLVMTITLFPLHVGVGMVGRSHEQLVPTINRLVQAAVGSVEEQEQARQELFAEYSGLQETPAGERGQLLTYRLYYDGLFRIPFGLVSGMLMTTVFCLVPCFIGTTFASKLLHQHGHRWTVIPAYLELMFVTLILILTVFFGILLPGADGRARDANSMTETIAIGIFNLFLILIGVMIYRRTLTWYWRMAILVGYLVLALSTLT